MTHVHTHEGYRALLMVFSIVFSPVALHEFRGFADSLRLGGVGGNGWFTAFCSIWMVFELIFRGV